jgi:hypothetical protein
MEKRRRNSRNTKSDVYTAATTAATRPLGNKLRPTSITTALDVVDVLMNFSIALLLDMLGNHVWLLHMSYIDEFCYRFVCRTFGVLQNNIRSYQSES